MALCNMDCFNCIYPDCILSDTGRSRVGYYANHKEKCKEAEKRYYQNHKEEINEKSRQRYAEQKNTPSVGALKGQK